MITKSNIGNILPPKALVWLILFIAGAIFFAFFRFLFLMTHLTLVESVFIKDIFLSFWIGFRFDAVILSIIILPLFLISLPPFIKFSDKLIQKITAIILSIIFGLIFLLCVADLKFFDNFGSRLNYWAIEYIEFPKMFLYTIVTAGSFWILISLWAILVIIFFIIVKLIFKRFGTPDRKHGRFLTMVTYLLLIILLAFGIRGRTGIKPLEWGEAYFSENHFINQMSLNSIYTLAHSIYEELGDGKGLFERVDRRFEFYDNNDAYQVVTEMLGIKQNESDRPFSLQKIVAGAGRFGFHPNIILIIMESWSADMIGALGGGYNISPAFDSLCRHGILFDNFYANGIRTNHGLAATLCSFPSLPGRSIMKRYSASYPFRSLAEVLSDYDYMSAFGYGGDIQFDNMKGFFNAVGYRRFYAEDDFDNAEQLSKWGIPDHIVFDGLSNEMTGLPRPFHLAVMTLSFHDPYLIPEDDRFKIYNDSVEHSNILNCFYYSDWAIGQFMNKMRTSSVFDSTIFIFTADHVAHQSARYPLSPEKFHIPLLLYSPALLGDSGRIVSVTGSQVDIVPTITGLLGLKTSVNSWGRDLLALNSADSGFAVIVASERLGLIEGSSFLFHWVGVSKQLFSLNDEPYLENNIIDRFPEKARRMEKRLNSYIQLANWLSRGRPERDSL